VTRRTILRAGVLGAVLIGGGAMVAIGTGTLPAPASAADGTSASAGPVVDRSTATVTSRTMTVDEELDGTLGFAGERRVVNGLIGTVTGLPATGKVLAQGDRLYELDGRRRPILFYGARPAWRTLEDGVTDGHDITQLEQNLKDLGYTRKGDVIDTEWDDDTTRAVKRWQKATGQTVDGIVEQGEVVFLPGAVRVTDLIAELGANVGPGTPILSGTTDERVVTVDLAADRTDIVKVGEAVEIELADGSTTPGTIQEIGTVAESGTDAFGNPISPSVAVTIGLDDPAESAAYTNSPVTVRIVRDSRDDVMAVPVASLLAILEGGYAVEVVDPSGSTHLVAVETGLFQDGWVEVTAPNGDLTVGADVVVPS
jgi:peptidoglycan hydrolase-like protein with peptidoglycan-binding domain